MDVPFFEIAPGSHPSSTHHVADVTRLLQAVSAGDADASDALITLVYGELRRMAEQRLRAGANERTLQPTALVHEAWLKLGGENLRGWENRAHFFATASTAMRSILVDRARRRQALRHGGGQARVDLAQLDVASPENSDDQILAVHDALEKLALEHPKKAELVKLRYFGGLTMAEASEVLAISEPTAQRWWAFARAWLGREMNPGR